MQPLIIRHPAQRQPASTERRIRAALWVGFVVACVLATWSGTHSVRQFNQQHAPAIAAKPATALGSP